MDVLIETSSINGGYSIAMFDSVGNSYGNSNVDPYVMSTSMFAYESTTPGASFSSSTSPDPRGLLDHER
jgi:hypothetical protein